jgi:hypothetical protein
VMLAWDRRPLFIIEKYFLATYWSPKKLQEYFIIISE